MRNIQKARGISLVEIVVTLACMAVLTAILLPSIWKVRQTGYRTMCMSNLHQIGVGVNMYSADNRSYVPHWFDKGYATAGTYGNNDSYEIHYPWFAVNVPPAVSSPNLNSYGLGLLWWDKYVTDPRIFWCPGQPDPTFLYTGRPEGPDWASHSPNSHMGYMFQLHHQNLLVKGSPVPNGDGTNFQVGQYTKITTAPPMALLAVDMLYSASTIAHGSFTAPYWNGLFMDGHVGSIFCPALPPVQNSWPSGVINPSGYSVNDLSRLDQAVSMLEAVGQ